MRRGVGAGACRVLYVGCQGWGPIHGRQRELRGQSISSGVSRLPRRCTNLYRHQAPCNLYSRAHLLPAPRPCFHRSYNPDASSSPPTAPTLIYSLKSLEEQLKAAYKLVTEGKFTDALKVEGGVRGGRSARLGAHWLCTPAARSPCSPLVHCYCSLHPSPLWPCCLPLQAFTRMLHTIPLTVVESRKEVDEVKELLSICKEYHIALRCELRRKELKEDQVRGARSWEEEMGCRQGAARPRHYEAGVSGKGGNKWFVHSVGYLQPSQPLGSCISALALSPLS